MLINLILSFPTIFSSHGGMCFWGSLELAWRRAAYRVQLHLISGLHIFELACFLPLQK